MLGFIIRQNSYSNTNYRRLCKQEQRNIFFLPLCLDIKFYLELSEELKIRVGTDSFMGFNPGWKAMKQQHCLRLSFVLVVIKACKAVGVDALKISRAVPCTLARSTLAFLQAEFLGDREQSQQAHQPSRKSSRDGHIAGNI